MRDKKLQKKIHKQAKQVTKKTKRDLDMENFLDELIRKYIQRHWR